MSNNSAQGEPAFPLLYGERDLGHNEGMSLRDWFAGQALVSIGAWMPAGYVNLDTDAARQARAEWAYQQADALLSERSKGEGNG